MMMMIVPDFSAARALVLAQWRSLGLGRGWKLVRRERAWGRAAWLPERPGTSCYRFVPQTQYPLSLRSVGGRAGPLEQVAPVRAEYVACSFLVCFSDNVLDVFNCPVYMAHVISSQLCCVGHEPLVDVVATCLICESVCVNTDRSDALSTSEFGRVSAKLVEQCACVKASECAYLDCWCPPPSWPVGLVN